jgi:cAMP-dependent protein kinase regulator
MVLEWLKEKTGLQGRGYTKDIAQLQEQLKKKRNDPRVRLQLAEVLIQAKRNKEAVRLLESVADDFALQGMAARAIAILKRLDKLDPGNTEVEEKLAYLISQQDNPMPSPWRAKAAERAEAAFEIGMEEFADSGIFKIGMESGSDTDELPPIDPALLNIPSPEAPVEAAPLEEEAPPARVEPALEEPALEEPVADPIDVVRPVAAPSPKPAPTRRPPAPAPAPMPAFAVVPPPPDLDLADDSLRNELIALIDIAFSDAPPVVPAVAGSPLFSDFRPDELMALIRGLTLHAFEPGEIVIAQGEPGDSLFILTSGTARAYMRDAKGRSKQVREMGEGDVFGEIAVMLAMPRTATVTAATRCELLELDRTTLDGISKSHPRVREVLQQFYSKHMSGA